MVCVFITWQQRGESNSHLSLERASSWPLDDAASYLRFSRKMRHKNQKPPICIGGSENCALLLPPLHERTFPRSLPREGGRCREAIGMGLAHHCVYLTFHSHMILEIRQYPKVAVLRQ